ncbi:DUF2927 domain-containing protein [Frigidibacter oleivorans]|uniref:DUF2927 domain-containing protein n=1 Tax=Frigidibacter oleivorans TaxID=2487129 RepID=UPI000F8D2EB9|nr:DUF2927 domain-containing protein [Frigidibacter oleivorans]
MRAATGLRAVRAALLAGALALSACVAAAPEPPTRAVPQGPLLPMPQMKVFGTPHPQPPARSNAEIARDILELSFRMESGRELPVLTRFEGPVTLHVAGAVPPTARADVDRLARRLRAEAGIDVRVAAGPAPAGGNRIAIEFLPRAQMQRLVPEAACFVVPRIGSWAEYRALRRSADVDWTTLTRRERAVVFVPSDTSPQEIRDCLHEEVAQALGPLNDLYSLPDSVFNDDNFHAVLTGFDMLVLRVYNAPELRSGMTRAEVAARLPALLARLNPRGGSAAQSAAPEVTPRPWIDAVERALGPRASDRARRAAAGRALAIAIAEDWTGARAGFSWFALGRLNLSGDLETAFTAFLRAALIYRAGPGMEVQVAHVDMQLAAFALSAGQAEDVLTFTGRAIPVVARAENAALLATLMFLRAEALDLQGRGAEARAERLDAMGWARYGFGAEAEVRRRMAEIAALSPPAQIVQALAEAD